MTAPSKIQGITYANYVLGPMQKATALELIDPFTSTHLRADIEPHVISLSTNITCVLSI